MSQFRYQFIFRTYGCRFIETLEIETSEGKQCLYATLICNSSDVPACRKVGGFVGHGAVKGCSRCLKSFTSQSFGDKSDYSGFHRTSRPKRTLDQRRIQGMAWKHARTMTDRNKIEREFGVRFTELLRLPYFDTIQFSVIDVMHNILLGYLEGKGLYYLTNSFKTFRYCVTNSLHHLVLEEFLTKYLQVLVHLLLISGNIGL